MYRVPNILYLGVLLAHRLDSSVACLVNNRSRPCTCYPALRPFPTDARYMHVKNICDVSPSSLHHLERIAMTIAISF
jgi:hypothetical protein